MKRLKIPYRKLQNVATIEELANNVAPATISVPEPVSEPVKDPISEPVTEAERYCILSVCKACFIVSSCDFEFHYILCRVIDIEAGESEGLYEGGIVESDGSESEPGDDCEVVVEDTTGYKEIVDMADVEEENEPELVEVRVCENLEEHFGDVAREDDNENLDEDGEFDIWDDDAIPDPLSDLDAEEAEGVAFNNGETIDDLLALGKTFNNADEFKYALLRYSLKTQYDITMYKSSSDRLGARCTQYMVACKDSTGCMCVLLH